MSESNELLFPLHTKSRTPFTVQEIAEITGFHPRTISRFARTRIIPGAYQTAGKRGGWRFKRDIFLAWWERQGAAR